MSDLPFALKHFQELDGFVDEQIEFASSETLELAGDFIKRSILKWKNFILRDSPERDHLNKKMDIMAHEYSSKIRVFAKEMQDNSKRIQDLQSEIERLNEIISSQNKRLSLLGQENAASIQKIKLLEENLKDQFELTRELS